MAYPPSLTTITVRGKFLNWRTQEPSTGTVRFETDHPLFGPTDDLIIEAINEKVTLDAEGEFSLVLPSNTDPQWTPVGYPIKVTITVGGNTIVGTLNLPHTGPTTVALADVLNVAAVQPGVFYLLAALKGAPNGVAELDGDGKVPVSQIPSLGAGGPVEWDDIQNVPAEFPPAAHVHLIADITALQAALDGKQAAGSYAALVHTHAQADITGLVDALAAKAPLASPAFTGTVTGITQTMVGLGNVDNTSDAAKPLSTAATSALAGKADLVGGVIPTAQIPALAVTEYLGASADQAAMLALTGQRGDWTIRTDLGTTWLITGTDPTQLADWTALAYPTAPVQSVNGQTGVVTLGKADVGLSAVDNTSDTAKPVSTATQTALNLKAPLASPTFTGTVAGVTKTMVGLGNVDNTSDTAKPISTATQTALDGLDTRVDDLEAMTPVILAWNGSAYAEVNDARVYVGPNDPGSVPNGSVWIDTTP